MSFSVSNINSPVNDKYFGSNLRCERYVLIHLFFIKADILEEEKTQINGKV